MSVVHRLPEKSESKPMKRKHISQLAKRFDVMALSETINNKKSKGMYDHRNKVEA